MIELCAHFGFKELPFTKEIEHGEEFESEALTNLRIRLNFLLTHKGIGLVSGRPGCGKTTFVRNFVSRLNPGLYKTIYLHHSNFSPAEFYRDLAWGLGLVPKQKRSDLCRQIAACITDIFKTKRLIPVIIIDEAQMLKRDILEELLLLTNYEMDSRDYMVLLMVGQQAFESTLSLADNEALMQRIVVRANIQPMSKSETKEYIVAHMKRVGSNRAVFDKTAIEAIFQTSKGIMRRTNRIALLGLEQSMAEKKATVTGEHVISGVTLHQLA